MSLLHLFQAATATPKTKSGLKRFAGAKFWAAAIGTAALTLMGTSAQAASFAGLGSLPSGSIATAAYAVSADGTVVVGLSQDVNFNSEAFRWTVTDGMIGLGFPDGHSRSFANAVSADGSIIVGGSGDSSGITHEAFRWTATDGMIGLGFPDGYSTSFASGVSADGSVVVGNSVGFGPASAFKWTTSDGIVGLGTLPDGHSTSFANAVSADGSVIVGSSRDNSSITNEAFRWTASDGIVGLGTLPDGHSTSFASDVSADGSVIVGGSGDSSGTNEAFRWTASDGIMSLGILPGGDNRSSFANAVSADGSVIVGHSTSDNPNTVIEASIWDSENGIRSLFNILTGDFGLDLTGWTLQTATDISGDGLTVVGNGINPDGRLEAWIAQLDPTPGSSQENPILPNLQDFERFEFIDVPAGQWYDPPAAFGFEYTMLSDSLFTQILDFPSGIDTDNLFTVTVGDTVLGEFGPGQNVDFVSLLGDGVSSFSITGIDPLVDGSDPTVFPIKLDFNTETASFEMRALTAATPEPSILIGLGTLALAAGALLKRKRQA